MDKLNKFWIGYVAGLVLPIGFMYAYIGLRYKGNLGPWELLVQMFELKGLTALIAVAAVPNLLVFYFFMNKEYWQGGRGSIMAVITYALVVMVLFFSRMK